MAPKYIVCLVYFSLPVGYTDVLDQCFKALFS